MGMLVSVRLLQVYVFSMVLIVLFALTAQTAPVCAVPAPVIVLQLDGPVSPVLADYVSHGIARAGRDGAQLIVLTIDTPGGLDSAMRYMIKSIRASRVPVASFVWPCGARAASAGTFIL